MHLPDLQSYIVLSFVFMLFALRDSDVLSFSVVWGVFKFCVSCMLYVSLLHLSELTVTYHSHMYKCLYTHTHICIGMYMYFIHTLPYMYKVKSGLILHPWRIRGIQEKDLTHLPE